MKSLLRMFVIATMIPLVAGCGAFGRRQQTPQVIYKPVCVPTVCAPAPCCPPADPTPCAVETMSPVQSFYVSP